MEGLPPDITREEVLFLKLVKLRMLKKLSDRQKIIFLMVYDLGYSQFDAAQVLDVTEGAITHQKYKIRELLGEFKK
jgi:DNA-directed RNA polymerase specialized sigma24 family protein